MKILPIPVLAAILLLAGAAPSPASTDAQPLRRAYRERILHDAERALPSRSEVARQAAASAVFAPDEPDRAARIPPGLAFLMSAAVPGTGQLAEGRNRAFAYLGLEAMSWIAHFSWKDAGDKKEVEYKRYADRHWSLDTWETHVDMPRDSCAALPLGVNPDDARTTLQGFIEEGNWQHYYEDIGKLEAYRSGWDDFSCDAPNQMSPNRVVYRSMRAKSNDYLNNARSALTVAFLNRIVSAVDAYRTARGARLRFGGGSGSVTAARAR